MAFIQMTFDDCVEQFNPIEKPGTNDIAFDIHSDDSFLETIPNSRIWTLVECQNEKYVITNGKRFVDRIYYYVTEVPHDENDEYDVE